MGGLCIGQNTMFEEGVVSVLSYFLVGGVFCGIVFFGIAGFLDSSLLDVVLDIVGIVDILVYFCSRMFAL